MRPQFVPLQISPYNCSVWPNMLDWFQMYFFKNTIVSVYCSSEDSLMLVTAMEWYDYFMSQLSRFMITTRPLHCQVRVLWKKRRRQAENAEFSINFTQIWRISYLWLKLITSHFCCFILMLWRTKLLSELQSSTPKLSKCIGRHWGPLEWCMHKYIGKWWWPDGKF